MALTVLGRMWAFASVEHLAALSMCQLLLSTHKTVSSDFYTQFNGPNPFVPQSCFHVVQGVQDVAEMICKLGLSGGAQAACVQQTITQAAQPALDELLSNIRDRLSEMPGALVSIDADIRGRVVQTLTLESPNSVTLPKDRRLHAQGTAESRQPVVQTCTRCGTPVCPHIRYSVAEATWALLPVWSLGCTQPMFVWEM